MTEAPRGRPVGNSGPERTLRRESRKQRIAGSVGRWCTVVPARSRRSRRFTRVVRGLAPHNIGMRSRVHPRYKTKYHVRNWAAYERGLVRRGDITVWLSADAIAAWEPAGGFGTRGGQRKYSDVAIKTALTLRLLLHLPLRQTEGFLTSLFRLMELDLPSPDHTTLSRRGQQLDVTLHHPPREKPLHLLIDSTGLSLVGEGEWAAARTRHLHGKHGWRKLHLAPVNRSGMIVAQALTDATTGRRADRHHVCWKRSLAMWRSVTADPRLRHPRVLRRREPTGARRSWCHRPRRRGCRRPPTTLTGTRSHDPTDHADAVGVAGRKRPGTQSAGPRGECRLPVQVDPSAIGLRARDSRRSRTP